MLFLEMQVLDSLFRTCTSLELKWFFHIVICDVERTLGIPHSSTIIFWFHKNADSFIKMGNSLRKTCELLNEKNVDDIFFFNNNFLCKPIRPMLLKRLEYNINCLSKVSLKNFTLNMNFRL